MIVGLVAGMLSLAAALPLLWASGSLASLSRSSGLALWLVVIVFSTVMALAGVLYGSVFMRAANDPRGGWLFGISYGFLLWMLGPVTLMQWILARPLVIGGAGRWLFAVHLLYGVLLGLLFPIINRVIQRRGSAFK